MREGYGDFIKRHRISSGYKRQISLAEKTGISAATISRIEKEVQKPEVRTLQTLAHFLTTTSFKELMITCGYWNEEDLLEGFVESKEFTSNKLFPLNVSMQQLQKVSSILKKETPTSKEEEFLESIDLTDDELIEQYDLKIDGKTLSQDETKGIIAYIRSLRQMKS